MIKKISSDRLHLIYSPLYLEINTMLNDKEITGRIASWDSNGNAVYVGELNNENFRIDVSGIKLLIKENHAWDYDEENGQGGLAFESLYDQTSIFSFNKIVITSLNTGKQITRQGNFTSTRDNLNNATFLLESGKKIKFQNNFTGNATDLKINLIDKISYGPSEETLEVLAIWNYYNNYLHKEPKNTISITSVNGDVTFNVRANKTIEHIKLDLITLDSDFRLEGNDLLAMGMYNDFSEKNAMRLKGFYNYDNPNNQLKTIQFNGQSFNFEQFKKLKLRLVGTEGNDIMYDWHKQVRSTFNAGYGNDKIYAGNGDDTLIGGVGNDLLQGGNGRDIYVFEKGHGQDIITEFNTTKDDDTLQFDDINFKDVKFRRDNYDLTLFGYNEQDSVTIKAFFANKDNQLEHYQFADRTLSRDELTEEMVLVNNHVDRMIHAMANFGTKSAGGVISSTQEDMKNQWQLAPSV